MTALCKPYATNAEADQAVADLLAAGVPGADVRLLMGAEIHDARREARGRFAGSVAPGERVGAYGGDGPERSALRGSFAGAADGAAPRAPSPTPIATSSSPITTARSARVSPATPS